MIQKISENIPDNELTCIAINKKEISVSEFKEKDELEYRGSMYDIVKKSETDSFYLFYSLNDIKEANLIKNFKQHFDDNKEKTNQNNSRIIVPLIAPAVIKNDEAIKRVDIISSLINHFNINYKSIWLDKFTPPPRS